MHGVGLVCGIVVAFGICKVLPGAGAALMDMEGEDAGRGLRQSGYLRHHQNAAVRQIEFDSTGELGGFFIPVYVGDAGKPAIGNVHKITSAHSMQRVGERFFAADKTGTAEAVPVKKAV